MSIKIGAIVLSRFDSSRLPGKALRKVKSKALLEYVLERAYKVEGVDGVCVATSSRNIDEPIVQFCHNNDVKVYRGSGGDVAKRFLNCMEVNNWDAAVRINGDSPLHSIGLLSQAVGRYGSGHIDIVTNVFPRSYPVGMSVELVSRSALRDAYARMHKASSFEHVTEYFYENVKEFNVELLPKNIFDHSKVKLAVDTQSDFERFKWIIEELGSNYLNASYQNIIDLYMSYEK
jgi:spore coat polysaccharide biosynthesis protein SpsF (cytidylyltransferase family)